MALSNALPFCFLLGSIVSEEEFYLLFLSAF